MKSILSCHGQVDKFGPLEELQRYKRGWRHEIKCKDLCDLLEMKATDGPPILTLLIFLKC